MSPASLTDSRPPSAMISVSTIRREVIRVAFVKFPLIHLFGNLYLVVEPYTDLI